MNSAFVETRVGLSPPLFFLNRSFGSRVVPFLSVHVVSACSIYRVTVYCPPPLASPPQPSSPGDYYSPVESDLKVELTEKLFSLDTDESTPANTEVCVP